MAASGPQRPPTVIQSFVGSHKPQSSLSPRHWFRAPGQSDCGPRRLMLQVSIHLSPLTTEIATSGHVLIMAANNHPASAMLLTLSAAAWEIFEMEDMDAPDIWLAAGFSDMMDVDFFDIIETLPYDSAKAHSFNPLITPPKTSSQSVDSPAADAEPHMLEPYFPKVLDFFRTPTSSRPTSVSFDCICCTRAMSIPGLMESADCESEAARLRCDHIMCLDCALEWCWEKSEFIDEPACCPFCRNEYDLSDVRCIQQQMVFLEHRRREMRSPSTLGGK